MSLTKRVGGETEMNDNLASIPDIDIAEELYMTRMTGLDTSLVPGYKELNRQVRTALDTLLAAYSKEDRLKLEDQLMKPVADRQGLLLSVFYRRGLIDGIKLMTNS